MTNIFTEVAVRLEKIQQKLLANKEANEHLQISFRNRLQENFNYLRYKYPQFYSSAKLRSKFKDGWMGIMY